MNDILHATDCSCGSKMQAVSTIEGRMDDLLIFQQDKIIFPDFIRRAITGSSSEIDNYQLIRVSDRKLNMFVNPEKHWNKLHLQIIWYGRQYCQARGWDLEKDRITKTIGRKTVLTAYYNKKKK